MGCSACGRSTRTTNSNRSAATPAINRPAVTNVQVRIKNIEGAQLTYDGQTYKAGDTLMLPSSLLAVLDVVELV